MTDTSTRKSFLGLPVTGDITYGERPVEQRPLEELSPLMQSVLDSPKVARFGWTQYTPYFNDGDPCVFGVNELWADPVVTADSEPSSDGYHEVISWDKRWGSRPSTFNEATKSWEEGFYVGPDEEIYDKLLDLNKAISSGAFNDVLLEAFGDHATVTVTREGITVEYYDHD